MIESNGQRMLVDCGPDCRQQLLDADVARLAAVIVTHDHADHCHGIDELRQVAYHVGDAIPLVARADVLDRLARRFGYAFRGSELYPAVLRAVEAGETQMLGNALLRFADQPHGGITSMGVRADEEGRSLAYSIDFHAMTDEMLSLYQNVDVWICDCLRRTPHPTHAHLDAVLGWARELGVGRLLLTHMDKSMDYATLSAELPDWAEPAFDGQEIVL